MTEGHDPVKKAEERRHIFEKYPEGLAKLMKSYVEKPDHFGIEYFGMELRKTIVDRLQTGVVITASIEAIEMRLEDEMAKLEERIMSNINPALQMAHRRRPIRRNTQIRREDDRL